MTYNSTFTGPEVDDAVNRRHTQNTDTALDAGGPNEVTAAEARAAADVTAQAHTQNTDTALDTGGPDEITAEQIHETAQHAIGLSYAIDLGTQAGRMAIDLRTDVTTLQADVVTAQDAADAAQGDADSAQSTANTAVSDAAAAQLTADDAQADATLALLQTVALNYATDVATVSAR